MFLVDFGDEPVEIVESGEELLPALRDIYNDPETILEIAKLNPGRWYRKSPYSWFSFHPNSPFRT